MQELPLQLTPLCFGSGPAEIPDNTSSASTQQVSGIFVGALILFVNFNCFHECIVCCHIFFQIRVRYSADLFSPHVDSVRVKYMMEYLCLLEKVSQILSAQGMLNVET
jgi:hypothetical protein